METPKRPRGRPFQKGGRSPNPSGRPRGSKNKAAAELDALFRKDAAAIVAAMVTMAQAGSVAAAKLVLDRVAIPARERPVQIDLGDCSTLDGIDAAHGVVLDAVGSGSVTPGEAASLSGLLDGRRRAILDVDLERRITELANRATELEKVRETR